MENQPNYFSVTPAVVRYHPGLCANAKLLYGELTALANRDGFAYPSNEYLANLYSVNERQIRRWLVELREAGFVQIIEHEGQRRIYIDAVYTIDLSTLTQGGADKKDRGGRTKKTARADEKDRHNNTINNIPTTEVVGADLDSQTEDLCFKLWCQKVKLDSGANPSSPAAERKALKAILIALKPLELPEVDKPINLVFSKAITEAQADLLKKNVELLTSVKKFACFVHLTAKREPWVAQKQRLALYLQNLNAILTRNENRDSHSTKSVGFAESQAERAYRYFTEAS